MGHEEFQKLIEEGLNDINAPPSLSPTIIAELYTISTSTKKAWAPFKATLAAVMAKIVYPEWDTRKHQTQIGGMFSLRTIDRCYIASTLYKMRLYDTCTEFALTRSFEKAEPFNVTYTGNITPKCSKTAFLKILHIINTHTDIDLCKTIMIYMLCWLNERRKNIDALKTKQLHVSRNVSVHDIHTLCDKVNKLGAGYSLIPVIIVHTICSVIQPLMWTCISLKPLKEHTAPDNHSKALGDVEGYSAAGNALLVIEVKHQIHIDDSIILTFEDKTRDHNVALKFILTTANTTRKCTQTNTIIDNVENFATNMLQHASLYQSDIYKEFLVQMRINVIQYPNLSLELKEQMDNIITLLLA